MSVALELCQERVRERLDPLITDLVAVGVVDRLQPVEVDQHERQRITGPAGALQLAGQILVEHAVVAQARERVARRHLVQAGQLLEARRIQPAALLAQHPPQRAEDDEREDDPDAAEIDEAALARVRADAELVRTQTRDIPGIRDADLDLAGECVGFAEPARIHSGLVRRDLRQEAIDRRALTASSATAPVRAARSAVEADRVRSHVAPVQRDLLLAVRVMGCSVGAGDRRDVERPLGLAGRSVELDDDRDRHPEHHQDAEPHHHRGQ